MNPTTVRQHPMFAVNIGLRHIESPGIYVYLPLHSLSEFCSIEKQNISKIHFFMQFIHLPSCMMDKRKFL